MFRYKFYAGYIIVTAGLAEKDRAMTGGTRTVNGGRRSMVKLRIISLAQDQNLKNQTNKLQ